MARHQNRVARDQAQHYVGPEIAPVIQIDPGEEVIVETQDCFGGCITDDSQQFATAADLLKVVTGLNPVNGPIAVRGAQKGDVLAVHVLDIKVGAVDGKAVTTIFKDFGGLGNPYSIADEIGPYTKVCRIVDGQVEFPLAGKQPIRLPVQPMIGTIWTAPADQVRRSAECDSVNCGNIDCPELGAGRTIYLPVSVAGGMLSLGDVHACMGDGEITGVAMETSADVRLRVDLIKAGDAQYVSCPQIADEETIGSVGCAFGRPLGDNVKAAFHDMVLRLERFHGFDKMDAYALLCQGARVRVHQVLDNWNAALVKLERKYLA